MIMVVLQSSLDFFYGGFTQISAPTTLINFFLLWVGGKTENQSFFDTPLTEIFFFCGFFNGLGTGKYSNLSMDRALLLVILFFFALSNGISAKNLNDEGIGAYKNCKILDTKDRFRLYWFELVMKFRDYLGTLLSMRFISR